MTLPSCCCSCCRTTFFGSSSNCSNCNSNNQFDDICAGAGAFAALQLPEITLLVVIMFLFLLVFFYLFFLVSTKERVRSAAALQTKCARERNYKMRTVNVKFVCPKLLNFFNYAKNKILTQSCGGVGVVGGGGCG